MYRMIIMKINIKNDCKSLKKGIIHLNALFQTFAKKCNF